jgi:hypothetical protein
MSGVLDDIRQQAPRSKAGQAYESEGRSYRALERWSEVSRLSMVLLIDAAMYTQQESYVTDEPVEMYTKNNVGTTQEPIQPPPLCLFMPRSYALRVIAALPLQLHTSSKPENHIGSASSSERAFTQLNHHPSQNHSSPGPLKQPYSSASIP